MGRGVAGRKRIVAYFASRFRSAGRAAAATICFRNLCQAAHEDGALLSTQDIIDH
jgi:hypothetical protein